MKKFNKDDLIWVDGVDLFNTGQLYYEAKIVAVLDDCYVLDPIEDSVFSPPKRMVVMFYQIDESGLIT